MEVTIVGGGPAGLTTAIALLRADPGARVTVLEKERYPREKICAGAIGRRGDDALAALGVTIDVPGATVFGMSLATRYGESAHLGTRVLGRVIRRIEFDAALARAAIDRGVRIVQGEHGRVTSGENGALTVDGEALRGIVIGADGVGSVVRRSMGLGAGDRALRAQVLEVDTPMVPRDRERTSLHFDVATGDLRGYFWDFPTVVDGEALVSRGVYVLANEASDASGVSRNELEDRLGKRLAAIGLDLDACRKKRFAERGFSRRETVATDDRMLVGEAVGIDPSTGEGIAPAIEMGALAGAFLARVGRNEAGLREWSRVLARSRVGLDMRVRVRAAHALYGDSRASLEALVASPRMMRAGCNVFAGDPTGPLDFSLLALSVARRWSQAKARRLFPSLL